jgi:tetratricopeptide (TPR) repeat protein
MYRVISFTAAAVAAMCVAAAPAAADDAEICRSLSGDNALAACGRQIARNPNNAEAYANRGLTYNKMGRYDRALDDLSQAIRLGGNVAAIYSGRCRSYHMLHDEDRAITDCSQAVTLDPKYAQAYLNRGDAYVHKGEFDRAIADFTQAITLDPKYALAYNQRGWAYETRRDAARAFSDYDQALRLAPNEALIRSNRERMLAALANRPEPPKTPVTADPATNAPRRVALVIGNSAYRAVGQLANPRRDATAVAEALRQTGFQSVELVTDLDRDGMVKALRAFRSEADRADWALVYFAGHGIDIAGVNYLIPVDATLRDDRDVQTEAVAYDELLRTVEGAKALRMVILDACRDNPFKARMARTGASRGSLARGLAPPKETAAGTLVVYSAKEGETADDDVDGVNSPFARAFIAQLKVPGREVRRLFDYVRDDVVQATRNRQQPWTYGSLPGAQDFFFMAGK